jgi:hypothetical protein
MRNIFLRHEDSNGKQMPDGQFEFRKFGPEGFCINVQVPVDNEHAWKFLQEVQQLMHYMSNGETAEDVGQGLKMLNEARAYFTTWRRGGNLVEHNTYEAMRIDRDQQRDAKEALQRDNDIVNQGDAL